MRDVLFVSHANPDDNAFALWLTLQLARRGYAVWCDLTQLLGGEDFWSDIETTIRERTAKFLYVLSEKSNHRDGVMKELALAERVARAHGLEDFVVPLKIDQMSHAKSNIRIGHLNAVPFHRGWAAGLRQLLDKVERDDVPKHPAFTAATVADWWRIDRPADGGVEHRPEPYLTNWFPTELPDDVHVHRLARYGGGPTALPPGLAVPAAKHGAYLVSFAPVAEVQPAVAAPQQLVESTAIPLADFLAGATRDVPIDRRQARNLITHLMRQAWEAEARVRGLGEVRLAGDAGCFFFELGALAGDASRFVGVDGRSGFRQLVGYATVGRNTGGDPKRRYWHFGLELKPILHPLPAFVAKPHVLFSWDGRTPWDDARALHRARRSACKHWWNPEWRDRILAAMSWLAGTDGAIALPLSSSAGLSMRSRPVALESPVAFDDPGHDALHEGDWDGASGDEDDEDDEEAA